MKNSKKPAKADAQKQKKQLVMLVGLSGVLVVIVAMQFGGGGEAEAYEVAALADSASSEPEPESEDSEDETIETFVGSDNLVLSEPIARNGLSHSPFANFWSTDEVVAEVAAEYQPPVARLSLTMPEDGGGVAVIDGRIHRVGDAVDGWEIKEIRSRAVLLLAPTGAEALLEMPLFGGMASGQP